MTSLDVSQSWAVMRNVPSTMGACELMFKLPADIDIVKARGQQADYKRALESLGMTVDLLPADDAFPDCCFVEDTAVIIGESAIVCRTGPVSRRGEAETMRAYLRGRGYHLVEMSTPAQMDGGDVLQIDGDVFVGISRRTNRAGYAVLAEVARQQGRRTIPVEVRGALHLKTVCTYVGGDTIVGRMNALGEGSSSLARFRLIQPIAGEEEAANASLVRGQVFIPSHCPSMMETLTANGLAVQSVDITEFQKAEAGLTCLTIFG